MKNIYSEKEFNELVEIYKKYDRSKFEFEYFLNKQTVDLSQYLGRILVEPIMHVFFLTSYRILVGLGNRLIYEFDFDCKIFIFKIKFTRKVFRILFLNRRRIL